MIMLNKIKPLIPKDIYVAYSRRRKARMLFETKLDWQPETLKWNDKINLRWMKKNSFAKCQDRMA